ncbi:unnamed protein product, partial [marine sediment metagenome]
RGEDEIMERNPKIVVVVLGMLVWFPTGTIGFASDPFGSLVQLAGSICGAWIAVSCVLKILAQLKPKSIVARDRAEEVEV